MSKIATGKTDGDLKEALVVCRESDAIQLEKVVAEEHSQTLVSVEERMSFDDRPDLGGGDAQRIVSVKVGKSFEIEDVFNGTEVDDADGVFPVFRLKQCDAFPDVVSRQPLNIWRGHRRRLCGSP